MQGGGKRKTELTQERGLDRCQMPCSQWDTGRPGSEDVRVIDPLLRFRLLRPRGTRFGGLTEPVLSLQWKRPSWCRRGATDYRLARRSPPRRPAKPSSWSRQGLAITLYPGYTCCLPRIIRPPSSPTSSGSSSSSSSSMAIH